MFNGLTFFGIPLEILLRLSEIVTAGCVIFGICWLWYILSKKPDEDDGVDEKLKW
jgi:hypothetical protein